MKNASSLPLEALPGTLEPRQGETMGRDITRDALASPTQVQTVRHGLSHIHHLLENDDAGGGGEEDSFSVGDLVMYHAKVAEFAAIVKEDSPALSLSLSFEFLVGASSVSIGRPQNLQYPITKSPFLFADDHVADSSEKTLQWMNNLRLPRSLAVPSPCMPTKFLDWPLWKSQEDEESAGAFGALHVNLGRSREKDKRVMCALKPRKEGAQKVSGMTELSHVYVDLNDLLLKCAHAIGSNNMRAAKEILVKVKQHATPYGNGEQRVAYYFTEALEARLAGTGWHIYLGNMRQHGYSPRQIWKASQMYMSSCPFAKAIRFFGNQIILDVAKGASTLHIREHQLTGYQYPSLFKALAARPGGPPRVRLIGVNAPHYSMAAGQAEEVLDRLEQTGRQIAACAASYGVPFHFTALAGMIGAFPFKDCISPNRSRDEVFVVVSVFPFRFINEELLNPPMKRLEIMKTMCAVNPEAYIQGIVLGSYNTPFFSTRFREALFHFESHYNMLDTFIDRENKDRIVFESEILGKAVMNIVACEETNVVERVDRYKSCYATTKGSGLEQMPLNQGLKQEVKKILKSWHKDYMVTEDLNYLLMGWKGRILHALSAWKGRNASRA